MTTTGLADYTEREYISQFAGPTLGITTNIGGQPGDVDGNAMSVTMAPSGGGPAVFSNRPAAHPAPGQYQVVLSSEDTQLVGYFTLTWSFAINGVAQTYQTWIQIGPAHPAYDALSDGFKTIVDGVWNRLADQFDSPNGGPNLQTYFQTHFSRGRLAQLLQIAVNRINTVAQPHMAFTVDSTDPFPYSQWAGVLDQALYIETLKHLRRSYLEQPSPEGVTTARMDRVDYFNRYGILIDEEERDFKRMLDTLKISFMSLSSPRVLVSGGVYGSYGPTRFAGSQAARPRYWATFFA